MQQDIN